MTALKKMGREKAMILKRKNCEDNWEVDIGPWIKSFLYLYNTFFYFVRIAVKAPKVLWQMQCTFPILHQRFLCPQSLLQSPLKLELQPYCLVAPTLYIPEQEIQNPPEIP